MDGGPPKIFEEEIDPDKPIPKYGRALQRLLDWHIQEDKMKQTPDSEVGLPERPEKRIKEIYRKDREELEKALNARGDSLYVSKRQEMHNPWAGAPGVGWGAQQSSPWAGWPGQPQSSSYGGWGGSYDAPAQESPFGRNTEEEENQDENSAGKSLDKDIFGSGLDNKFGSDDEFTIDGEKDAGNEDVGDDESITDDDNLFKKAGKAFEKGESTAFNDEYDNQEGDFSEEDKFGNGPLSSTPEYNDEECEEESYDNNTAVMKSNYGELEGDSSLETHTEKTPSDDQDLDPYGRPKKRLKPEFMKDREELETMLNEKGESIYRRFGEPPPGGQVPPDASPGGYGRGPPPGYPDRGRILGPDELRAQMALQKIARAALRVAARRKGRRGKTSVVFI